MICRADVADLVNSFRKLAGELGVVIEDVRTTALLFNEHKKVPILYERTFGIRIKIIDVTHKLVEGYSIFYPEMLKDTNLSNLLAPSSFDNDYVVYHQFIYKIGHQIVPVCHSALMMKLFDELSRIHTAMKLHLRKNWTN